ncbi:MAG: histidine kinase [Bacteroidota bacterium]
MKIAGEKILDRKLIHYLLLFCFISFLITTASKMLQKWEGVLYEEYESKHVLLGILVVYVAKFIFIMAAIIFVRFLFLKGIVKGWHRFLLHLILGVGLAFHSVFSQVILYNWLFESEIPFSWNYIYIHALNGADFNFFLYFSMIAIVNAYYFFKSQKDFELRESNLKTQLLDSKVNSLLYQLQPHFLFNALNDISSLIDVSTEKSQNAIADLSEMLRQTLTLKDTKLIPLSQELGIIRKYLGIEKMRFDEKLNFKLVVGQESLNQKVPPLILQPIVENSIKHGFSYQRDHLNISIVAKTTAKHLEITITNDGASFKKDEIVFGTGISNVISRLDTLYDGDFVFEMDSYHKEEEEGVKTFIRIPSKR